MSVTAGETAAPLGERNLASTLAEAEPPKNGTMVLSVLWDGAPRLSAVPSTRPETERLRQDGVGRIVDDGASAFANKPGEELGVVGGERRGIRDDDKPRGGLHGGGNGWMKVAVKPAAGERGDYAARKSFHPRTCRARQNGDFIDGGERE